MSDKFLYTDVELTIHQDPPVNGSRTLLPGQFIALADLLPNEQEAATQGKIPNTKILTLAQVQLLQEQSEVTTLPGATIDSGEEDTSEQVQVVGRPILQVEDNGVVSKIEST